MNRDNILRMAIECQLVTTGNRDGIYMEALERFADLVAAEEREACARVCEEVDRRWVNQAEKCAERIRARGE